MPAPATSHAHHTAAKALARGLPVADAAAEAEIHPNSLYRLKKTLPFKALVERYRDERRDSEAEAEPTDADRASELAVATWTEIAKDRAAAARDRIKAAENLDRWARLERQVPEIEIVRDERPILKLTPEQVRAKYS